MLETLNSTLTRPGLLLVRQMHCNIVPVQAMTRLSDRLIVVMAINTKRKLADMVPVIPGKRTLNPDARVAMMK